MIALLNYLPLGIFIVAYFAYNVEGYCKYGGNINIRNSLIKITKIEPLFIKSNAKYYDDNDSTESYLREKFDDGEVSWDLPENNIEISGANHATATIQFYNKNIYDNSIYDNSIYEKYFKNRLYLRLQTGYIKEAYSALIKNAYKDIIKFETFAYDIQDLVFNNVRGASVESDLALLLLATGLGLLYNKNKAESIETMKLLRQSTRIERLETYRQIRRLSGAFFIIAMAIFGRNIKNAE
jgi:hypothetical protein